MNKETYIKNRRKKAVLALFAILLFGLFLYGFSNKEEIKRELFSKRFENKQKTSNHYLKNFFAKNNIAKDNLLKQPQFFTFKKVGDKIILDGTIKIASLGFKKKNPVFTIKVKKDWIEAIFSKKLNNTKIKCKGILRKKSLKILVYTCFNS